MSFPLSRAKAKLLFLYRRHVLRDRFLLEADRWFQDRGDETLRLNYSLSSESVVFDVGGYRGDFAEAMHRLYGCKVYLFEPVREFYSHCVNRFSGNKDIICLNYGLSSSDGWFDIELAENASGFNLPNAQGATQRVRIRSVVDCIKELGVDEIDLMKLNIEGGEFEVLPAIIRSGDILKINNLQIQFHHFVSDAATRRADIRSKLSDTHDETWSYDFIWENWQIKRHQLELEKIR